MKVIVIAIDGESASGKGTLGKNVARELDFAYLDTGLLYRQTAFNVMKNNGNINSEADAAHAASQVSIATINPDLLRGEDISQGASVVAAYPAVRAALLGLQRDFAKNPPNNKRGAVLDGRDIGTVVCPDADIKLYVTADAAIRAARRHKELQDKGITAIQGQVLDDLKQRDHRDAHRSTAPLRVAPDAWVVDTTHGNADEVLAKVLDYITKTIKIGLVSPLGMTERDAESKNR